MYPGIWSLGRAFFVAASRALRSPNGCKVIMGVAGHTAPGIRLWGVRRVVNIIKPGEKCANVYRNKQLYGYGERCNVVEE